MKKIKIIFIISLVIAFALVAVFILNRSEANNTEEKPIKVYTYTGEGFGGEFTITIRDDGTASFYEGYLSSYIGEGTWSLENDILYLNDNVYKNKFKIHNDELEFIEEGSSNFPYVQVKNGEKFMLNK